MKTKNKAANDAWKARKKANNAKRPKQTHNVDTGEWER